MQSLNTYAPMNPDFAVRSVDEGADMATIVIEPLEKGYGHTLGNALRRVLLTSLPGQAITSVTIDGVDHQYTTLSGMSEDVLELILNLKQIRVKSDRQDKSKLTLDVKGPKEVTAADVVTEAGYEIINQDLHLATLAKGKTLKVEMIVEPGIGYVLNNEKKPLSIGEIPTDSMFSPVVKVTYKVEQTRVGRSTDFDKVVMMIKTDGTITPKEAVEQAAMILARQFTQVFNPVVKQQVIVDDKLSPKEAEVLRLTVEELDLPTRIANALRKGGYKTVGDLSGAPRDVIAKVKNLGEKSVDVINEALEKKGVTLGE